MRFARSAALALALPFAVACGSDGPSGPTPTSLSVSPLEATLRTGETLPLVVDVLDERGSAIAGAAISFTSSAPSVATVSDAGVITAVSPGPSTITARSGALSRTVAVTVVPPFPAGDIVGTTPIGVVGGMAGIAVSSSGIVYSAGSSTRLTRLDATTRQVTGTLQGQFGPAIAFSPTGTTLYASGPVRGQIAVIDAATNALTGTIDVFPGRSVDLIEPSPDGRRLYARLGVYLWVVDLATRAITDTIPLPSIPRSLTAHPTRPLLYIPSENSEVIHVFDVERGELVEDLELPGGNPLPPHVRTVAITRDGRFLYAAAQGRGEVVRIDLNTGQATGSIPLQFASLVALSPGDERVYATGLDTSELLVIDRASFTVVRRAILPGNARSLAVSPDGRHLVVGVGSPNPVPAVVFLR